MTAIVDNGFARISKETIIRNPSNPGALTGDNIAFNSSLTINEKISTITGVDLTASSVANVPSGNLAATNVQDALNELQTEIDTKAPVLGSNDNYVTDAEKVVIGNTSGTNTGDETATRIGALIGGAGDATPNDTDYIATSLTAGGILKRLTWTNAKAFLKTYFDTIYAKYLGDADFYQYSISRTIDGSNNLVITVLNYLGATPSPTAPIKYKDGTGVIRTISSALSVTFNAGTGYLNAGSAELATKEIDYFVMLQWNTTTSATNLLVTRFPSAITMVDITNSNTNEKGAMGIVNYNSTDGVINIGRFNATLSAGAGYTWSIPATSVIVNRPIYETRWLNYQPIYSGTGSMTMTSVTTAHSYYKILGNILYIRYSFYGTIGGVADSGIKVTLPISTSYLQDSQLVGLWNGGRQTGDIVTYNSFFEIRRYPANYTLGTDNGFNGNIFLSI